jgi:site-specific recombinase XerD
MEKVQETSDGQLAALMLQVRDMVLKEVVPQLSEIAASLKPRLPAKGRRKGFNLVKRESGKHGFLYYVRYWHDGRMLPSKWCTHTNNPEEAEKFALKNKAYLITRYLERQEKIYFYKIFSDYFKEDSEYYKNETRRNRKLSDHHRQVYDSVVNNYFIPYLKGKNVNAVEKIDGKTICAFQDHLLLKGLKPQTVNDYLSGIKKIFTCLCGKGRLANNPFNNVKSLIVTKEDKTIVGCHEIEKLKSAFTAGPWSDRLSYLLCLLVYSTGMRNSEIEGLRIEDLIEIEGCAFLDIKDSKTRNGVRLVPLHGFVKTRLTGYITENKREGYIFTKSGKPMQSYIYKNANMDLAKKIGVTEKEIKEQNIEFHSGRHFWKTLMNSENLGDDIEEIFMGHSVSSDVAKRYNHKDKQGKSSKLEKVKKAFEILDKTLFL